MNWAPSDADIAVMDRLRGKLGISDSDLLRLGLRKLYDQEFPPSVSDSKAAD